MKKVGWKAVLYILVDLIPAVGIGMGFGLLVGATLSERITGLILLVVGIVALAFMVKGELKDE